MTTTPDIPTTTPQLRRVLDVPRSASVLLVTRFSLRWIATAAAAGPSALVIWVDRGARVLRPARVHRRWSCRRGIREEGGIYVWSKRAFGPFAGVHHRLDVLGLEPAVFPGAAVLRRRQRAVHRRRRRGSRWSTNSTYFIAVSMTGLTIAVTLNVVGLNVGKWLNNIGAHRELDSRGAADRARRRSPGAASDRRRRSTRGALVPSTSLKDVIFWSTIAFAFGGVESASTMGEEIQDARRTVPRAILTAGALITVLYLAGTLSVLLAIPREQVSGLQGIMQAIQAMTAKVGLPWLAPIVAALVTLNALGGVGGWFAATARLPFVAGIDRFLPPAFGALHPRWRTPYVALLVQAAIAGAVRVSRPGRHVGARRLRRARQHERSSPTSSRFCSCSPR